MAADSDLEEGQFRPINTPAPRQEEEPEDQDEPVIEVDVEPIRRVLRQEILVFRRELRQEIRAELHIGPLPHPDTLAAYDQIVPGSAEKIIHAFVRQGEHREELETYALHADNYRSWGGLIAGFVISVIVLVLSYELIRNGYTLEGTGLAVINLSALAGVFVYGTRSRREERVQKTEIMSDIHNGRQKKIPEEVGQ